MEDDTYEVLNKPLVQLPVEIAFGCRDPSTKNGSWYGSFVYYKEQGIQGKHIIVIFDNGFDYINENAHLEKAIETYHTLQAQGWNSMSTEDIERTVGIIIDQYTQNITDVSYKPVQKVMLLPSSSSSSCPVVNVNTPPPSPPFMVPLLFALFISGLIFVTNQRSSIT